MWNSDIGDQVMYKVAEINEVAGNSNHRQSLCVLSFECQYSVKNIYMTILYIFIHINNAKYTDCQQRVREEKFILSVPKS